MAKKQTKYNMAGQIGTMAASNPKNSTVVYSPEDSKKSIAKQAAASTAKAKWDAFINGPKIGSSVFPNVGIAPTKVKNSTKKNTSTKTIDNTYNLSDYYDALVGAGATPGTPGSGGYYTLDNDSLNRMLAGYEQQANANRQTAKHTYDTTRSDLLTSLKRFQEQNAKQVESQKRSYLTGQANLETARSEADRATRISAAARGLGGSGLQQLGQLQNLLNQSQDISELALENQNVMENLRTALANQEADTNTQLDRALNVYNNALNDIDAQLANNIANAYVQRANSYVPGSPGSPGSAGVSEYDALSTMNAAKAAMSGAVDTFKSSIGSIKKSKRKEAYNTAKQNLYTILEQYQIDPSTGAGKKAVSNLEKIYKKYK